MYEIFIDSAVMKFFTGTTQVRLYSKSHRDIKPPSFDEHRWSHKKDPTCATGNEKQMTYHYLITGGEFFSIKHV